MTEGNKELLTEIASLREDLKQLREVVNVLVNVVMEEDLEEEEHDFPGQPSADGRFNMLN